MKYFCFILLAFSCVWFGFIFTLVLSQCYHNWWNTDHNPRQESQQTVFQTDSQRLFTDSHMSHHPEHTLSGQLLLAGESLSALPSTWDGLWTILKLNSYKKRAHLPRCLWQSFIICLSHFTEMIPVYTVKEMLASWQGRVCTPGQPL